MTTLLFTMSSGVILLASCTGVRARGAAQRAGTEFLRRCGRQEYERIYRDAYVDFRIGVSEDLFLRYMAVIHRTLGGVRCSDRVRFWVAASTDGTQLQEERRTTFQRGEATERFIWHVERDSAMLVRYDILSPALPPCSDARQRQGIEE